MSINANITSVVSASAGSTHSGSFAKLYVTHTTIFERIEFGTSKDTRYIDGYSNGDKVESVKNRIVIFDSNIPHTGTTVTNQQRRVVLNINYYPNS